MQRKQLFITLLTCGLLAFGFTQMIGQVKFYSEQEVQNEQLLIEAIQLKNQAKFEEALEKTDQLIRLEPENSVAFFERSRIMVLMKNDVEAIRSANEAYSLESNNYWIADHLASLYIDNSNFENASEIYSSMASLNPRDEDVHYKAAYCYLKSGNTNKALGILNNLENQMGIKEEISQKKFDIYIGIEKPKKAIKELEKLINRYPENTQFIYNLASYLMQTGDKDKADEWFKKILDIDPEHKSAQLALQLNDSKAGSDISYLYSIRGLIENRSIPLDNKILELIPYVEKNANLQDEALDQILLELVRLLEKVHPAEAKVYALKGDILINTAAIDQAKEAYIQSLNFDRSVYSVWANLMYACFYLEDAEKLAAYAEQAIDFFPNQPLSYYYFGKSHWMRGQQDNAIKWMKEGLVISGRNNTIRYDIQNDLIQLYIQLNTLENAQKILDKLSQDPMFSKHPILLETAGDLAFSQGLTIEAIDWWTKALKAGNQSPLLKEKINQKKLIK
jgi:predicted Zn-dependent protease